MMVLTAHCLGHFCVDFDDKKRKKMIEISTDPDPRAKYINQLAYSGVFVCGLDLTHSFHLFLFPVIVISSVIHL